MQKENSWARRVIGLQVIFVRDEREGHAECFFGVEAVLKDKKSLQVWKFDDTAVGHFGHHGMKALRNDH
jgi:hypothetical protein